MLLSYLVPMVVLLAATYFDERERRIPNGMTLPAICFGIVLALARGNAMCVASGTAGMLIAVLMGFSGFLAMGDAKLLMVIASFCGAGDMLIVLSVAAVVATIISVVFYCPETLYKAPLVTRKTPPKLLPALHSIPER